MWISVQFCLAEDSPDSLNESVEGLELCGNRLSSRVPGIKYSHCACASPQRVHWTYDSCSDPVRPSDLPCGFKVVLEKN